MHILIQYSPKMVLLLNSKLHTDLISETRGTKLHCEQKNGILYYRFSCTTRHCSNIFCGILSIHAKSDLNLSIFKRKDEVLAF